MDKMKATKAIGIFGGTFDPIHFGHLRAAEEVLERLALDEMRLIPCGYPPHRGSPIASAIHRLNMTKLAAKNTNLIVDDREIQRQGPSYSVDTLMSLRHEFPKNCLCFCLGLDAFLNLTAWHDWEKLIQLTNIVVLHRGGWDMPTTGVIAEFLTQNLLEPGERINNFASGKIIQQVITPLDIKGSSIRASLEAQHSVEFLLPHSVIEYIQQHNLYGYKDNLLAQQIQESN